MKAPARLTRAEECKWKGADCRTTSSAIRKATERYWVSLRPSLDEVPVSTSKEEPIGLKKRSPISLRHGIPHGRPGGSRPGTLRLQPSTMKAGHLGTMLARWPRFLLSPY